MGTRDYSIKGNDVTLDIYDYFIDEYNSGKSSGIISNEIFNNFKEYFADCDDKNDAIFGLALAQWETKSLTNEIYNMVREIIDSDSDLNSWKNRGADDKELNKRKNELKRFLKKISIERKNIVKKRKKFDFKSNEIVNIMSPNREKSFVISEVIANGEYIHTGGILEWIHNMNGAGIIYFNKKNALINAKWINNNKILIMHDKSIIFIKKEVVAQSLKDKINIEYKDL
jgi:hypothetical protein